MQAQANLFELLADSQKKGMGLLGLWLCKHIVMRHGGTIHYEPNLPTGARFIIQLPVASKAI
ncbi:HAMP domain-containing histidine kinase [Polynucleobacter necessarius]|uniref:HAMP domain-containing histidine kinase n=1 Tax=Polynucleobacter necessarius TaxID=576610 RepID=UPI0018D59858|nr:HAMP domain-containing histidine kinase [Polynucleobacter necessarius]